MFDWKFEIGKNYHVPYLPIFIFLVMMLCCDITMQAIGLVKYLMADMKLLPHMGRVSFPQLYGQKI